MDQPRPRPTWPAIITLALLVLTTMAYGLNALGAPLVLILVALTVGTMLAGIWVVSALRAEKRYRLAENQTKCSHCATKVPEWFMEHLDYKGVFGAATNSWCLHCAGSWPYPEEAESEDEYIVRRGQTSAEVEDDQEN